jgi:hypothetical protein
MLGTVTWNGTVSEWVSPIYLYQLANMFINNWTMNTGDWMRKNASQIAGVFRRLSIITKTTISFVMSVCLSVRPSVCLSCMEHVGSNRKDFYEILYLSIFRKFVKEIQFFKPKGITCTLHVSPLYIYDNILLNSSSNENFFGQNS